METDDVLVDLDPMSGCRLMILLGAHGSDLGVADDVNHDTEMVEFTAHTIENFLTKNEGNKE